MESDSTRVKRLMLTKFNEIVHGINIIQEGNFPRKYSFIKFDKSLETEWNS